MKGYTDKNEVLLRTGQLVLVQEPDIEDAWEHGFIGEVMGFRNDWVQIVDGEGLVWEMEPEKTEIQED